MKSILRFVRNGIDLVDEPQLRDQRIVKEVRIDTTAELEELTFWTDKSYRLRIWVPADLLVMNGAFKFQGGWNPFVEALDRGEETLRWYFDRFMPQSAHELPWFGKSPLMRNDADRGGSYHVASHLRRLTAIRDSILKHGYQPDRFGDIAGCLLKRREEGRFLVSGGKHRVAILAAAGWPKIPVTFKPTLPRSVDRTTVHSWPLVRSGVFNATTALSVFDSYFDLDGTQQLSSVP